MISRDDHDALVSMFYAAATGDRPWAEALGGLVSTFGGSTAVFNVTDPANQVIAVETYGRPRDFAAEYYAGELFANDPRSACLMNVRPGTIYYDHMLYDVEEMARNRWCQEACHVLGVKYQLGARIRLPGDSHGAYAVLSDETAGHATDAAIAAFRRLSPQIEQACALGHVLEAAAVTRAALLQGLADRVDGVMLLSRTGAPTFINDAARAILSAGDGLALIDGSFRTLRPPETRTLNRLMQGIMAPSDRAGATLGGKVLVTRASGRLPYAVSVMAAPPTERFLSGQSIGCVVYIQDLAAVRLPSRASLAAVFGLSERESDLAIELVRCAGLEAAAAGAGMAVNTARSHLQSISRKTGARGQAEIVQLLGRLA